jgi:hypothetical protein
MFLCNECFDAGVHRGLSTRAYSLVCCGCKGRKPCFLVIRRRLER